MQASQQSSSTEAETGIKRKGKSAEEVMQKKEQEDSQQAYLSGTVE